MECWVLAGLPQVGECLYEWVVSPFLMRALQYKFSSILSLCTYLQERLIPRLQGWASTVVFSHNLFVNFFAYGRHQLSWPMRIEAPIPIKYKKITIYIFFWRDGPHFFWWGGGGSNYDGTLYYTVKKTVQYKAVLGWTVQCSALQCSEVQCSHCRIVTIKLCGHYIEANNKNTKDLLLFFKWFKINTVDKVKWPVRVW